MPIINKNNILTTVLLSILSISANAKDASLFENFESVYFRTIQNITIEKNGVSALFEGGAIYFSSKNLHYSGSHSWLVAASGNSEAGLSSGEGFIKPKGNTRYVSALVRAENQFTCGFIQAADSKNNLIYEQQIVSSEWLPVEIYVPDGKDPIKEIRISHCGSTGLIAVDDLVISTKDEDEKSGSFSVSLILSIIGIFVIKARSRLFPKIFS